MNPEALASLFPGDVAVAIATPEMYAQTPPTLEADFIRRAGQKRRREFAAGRAAARHAISQIRPFSDAIAVNSDRTPQWPEDIVGSISHCDGFCAAAVGLADKFLGIGLDAETNVPIEQPVLQLLFDEEETAHLAALPDGSRIAWDKAGFSAKEAFYKCHYPRTKQFLNFRDLRIRFEPAPQRCNEGLFVISVCESKASPTESGMPHIGKFIAQDGTICTAIILPGDRGRADSILNSPS